MSRLISEPVIVESGNVNCLSDLSGNRVVISITTEALQNLFPENRFLDLLEQFKLASSRILQIASNKYANLKTTPIYITTGDI